METIVINITHDSKALQLTVPTDLSIEEWADQFKTILTWLTFHPDTIKEIFPEEL